MLTAIILGLFATVGVGALALTPTYIISLLAPATA